MIDRLIRYKVYFDRARMYYGYGSFFVVILILFKDTAIGDWVFQHKLISFPVILFALFAVAIVIGYLDKRYIRPREAREVQKINPIFMDMWDKVNEIHNRIVDDEED